MCDSEKFEMYKTQAELMGLKGKDMSNYILSQQELAQKNLDAERDRDERAKVRS